MDELVFVCAITKKSIESGKNLLGVQLEESNDERAK